MDLGVQAPCTPKDPARDIVEWRRHLATFKLRDQHFDDLSVELWNCRACHVAKLGHLAPAPPNLPIRRYLCRHPDPFESVPDLGRAAARCSRESEVLEGRSPGWLPGWLPAAHDAQRELTRSGRTIETLPVTALTSVTITTPSLNASVASSSSSLMSVDLE
jgi:hypothetical protein